MSSEVALFRARRNGGLSFHTSPVTQFRRPNSLAKRFLCASKARDLQLREEILDHLLQDGNSCGTADKSNIMNIALVDPAVTEALLHGTHGISEIVHVPLLKLCFRQQEKSMSSKRESISLVACVEEDRVRLGTFTPCPETNDSSQADALKRVDVESDFNLRHATCADGIPSR